MSDSGEVRRMRVRLVAGPFRDSGRMMVEYDVGVCVFFPAGDCGEGLSEAMLSPSHAWTRVHIDYGFTFSWAEDCLVAVLGGVPNGSRTPDAN